jgi:hypothetical protein
VYIRKTSKSYKGKSYDNYLLVESVSTPKGPRQKIVCSLGSLAPAPREEWLALAHRMEARLNGQESILEEDAAVTTATEKGRRRNGSQAVATRAGGGLVAIDPERVSVEEAREAGSVHVGHQMWEELGLDDILARAGLSTGACVLSEIMTLNRLIDPLSEHAMPDWIRSTALADILGKDFSTLDDEALYRNLDRIIPIASASSVSWGSGKRACFS